MIWVMSNERTTTRIATVVRTPALVTVPCPVCA